MKRILWLTATALALGAAWAGAQTPYIVRAGQTDTTFSVTRNNQPVATNADMDSVLRAIRMSAYGNPVVIQFGGGADSVLDVGKSRVWIHGYFDPDYDPGARWGHITLTGKIKSETTGYVFIQNNETGTMLNVTSRMDISTKKGSNALFPLYYVALTVEGGKIENGEVGVDNSNYTIQCVTDGTSLKITGGEFEHKGGGTVMLIASRSDVVISDTSVKFINESSNPNRPTIGLPSGNVSLGGASVINRDTSGYAIAMWGSAAELTLTGPAPKLTGSIFSPYSGVIRADSAFSPGANKYALSLVAGAAVDGAVAVKGGGAHLAAFAFDSKYLQLAKKGDDIAVALKPGVTPPKYAITGDSETGFTAVATTGAAIDSVAKKLVFSALMDSVYAHADGRPCGIQLGDGNAVLNIAQNGISFSGWGKVSLSGKATGSGELGISGGTSVENSADFTGGGVRVYGMSEFTHKSGILKTSITNNGIVTISGGTVGNTLNLRGGAVSNGPGGELIIKDSASVISADTTEAGATIINRGTLVISGGKVSNISDRNHRVAVRNGTADSDSATATATISGKAEISSPSAEKTTSENGVVCNNYGSMEISGDSKISSGADSGYTVVINRYKAKMKISGNAEIKAEGVSSATYYGVVYNSSSFDNMDSVQMSMEISGGKISANGGYAVYGNSFSRTAISGTANISSAYYDGAVYVGNASYIYLLGGTVSSTANDSAKTIKAISIYPFGRAGQPGRLVMGGSPTVNGSIGYDLSAYTSDNGYPILIQATGVAAFSPGAKKYGIAIPVAEGSVLLENGARFTSAFAIDSAFSARGGGVGSNSGFKLAANGNDAVATKLKIWNVAFDLVGGKGSAPAAIQVLDNGTLGTLARPETDGYLITKADGKTYKNDGKWYSNNGKLAGGEWIYGSEFDFGDTNSGKRITDNLTLLLFWTNEVVVSVRASAREIPAAPATEAAAFAPLIIAAAGEFTAGPNPLAKRAGKVAFFWNGAPIKSGELTVFDAAGNAINKVTVSDPGAKGKRAVAYWNLTDYRGRPVADGVYAVKGIINAASGKAGKVSILISAR
jgi:hypothetical protein